MIEWYDIVFYVALPMVSYFLGFINGLNHGLQKVEINTQEERTQNHPWGTNKDRTQAQAI